jgi:predicted nucleic acid-binding protein
MVDRKARDASGGADQRDSQLKSESMGYWDTSALAKLYVLESDSAVFEAHAESAAQISISETGRLELRTVLRRREAEGSLGPGSTRAMHDSFCGLIAVGRFIEQRITPELEAEFFALLDACLGHNPPVLLRTNDCLHLAAAKRAGETEIVTTDKGLRKAALFLGFSVFPAS